ncbi:MAG: exo-beta-N-acetylmuramidase NamZ family protein [Psychroflexus halocasei]
MCHLFRNLLKNTVLFLVLFNLSCQAQEKKEILEKNKIIQVGANQTQNYIPFLKNKNIAVVGNQTSVIFKDSGYIHLVDSLLKRDVKIKKVFAPEHGFRGKADAGEIVKDGIDQITGLPIVSLYGNHKKPKADDLKEIDVIVFDIQDVGARFYTYISSLHYIMEAAAENDVSVLVLDRPNPNGHYIDGPILEKEYQSFVGMHPVPIVHGLTIGEYAKMINGEKWLASKVQAQLKVIKVGNYKRKMPYSLPIKPSPNLPNDQAINLYTSLCFFEGTNVNAGRGTNQQFQVFGSPFLNKNYFDYSYTPVSNPGAKYPKHENKLCFGKDLTQHKNLSQINLEWLIEAYNNTSNHKDFFNNFFNKLAGNKTLQEQIKAGLSAEEIKASWQKGLENYKKMRAQYLLYN